MALSDKSTSRAAHTLTLYAMLLAEALILSYVEALLPPLGIWRLGLANIAVTCGIYMRSRRCGLSVMLCRVSIVSLLFGSVTSFAFSLGGGLFAWSVAAVLKPLYKTDKISLIGVSVLSAAAHNFGQVLAACAVLSTLSPLSMLWWLLLVSVPAGILTGIAAEIVVKRIGGKLER